MARVQLQHPPVRSIAWPDRGQKWARAGDLKEGGVLVVNQPVRRIFTIQSVVHSSGRVLVTACPPYGALRSWSFNYRTRVQVA